MDSGFQVLDSKSFSVDLGFRIPIVSGIPDSYSCIPDSKAQDSGFNKKKISNIPDSIYKNFPDSGIPYIGRNFNSRPSIDPFHNGGLFIFSFI